MRIYDGFLELCRLDDEYKDAGDLESHFGMGVAIDLWDGMLKGLGGEALQEKLRHLIDAYERNAAMSPETKKAYDAATEVAQMFLEG